MIEAGHRDAVTVLRLNRPPVNAMSLELLRSLTETMRATHGPVVVTGTGRVFSAGVDLRQVLAGDARHAATLIDTLAEAFLAVFEHPAPTVAAINGAAIAGGCVLALACDVRLVVGGRIGLTEMAVGVPFPRAGLEIVRHALGSRVTRVVLRAEPFGAEAAVRLGLVDEQLPADGLMTRAVEIAAGMAPSPTTYALVKSQLHEPVRAALAQADDSATIAAWSAPETRERISRQLESLRRGDS